MQLLPFFCIFCYTVIFPISDTPGFICMLLDKLELSYFIQFLKKDNYYMLVFFNEFS